MQVKMKEDLLYKVCFVLKFAYNRELVSKHRVSISSLCFFDSYWLICLLFLPAVLGAETSLTHFVLPSLGHRPWPLAVGGSLLHHVSTAEPSQDVIEMGADTLLVRHNQPRKEGLWLYVPLLLHVSHSDFLLLSTISTPQEGLSFSRLIGA